MIAGILWKVLLALGTCAAVYAIVCERRMQRHRQPGVGYWQATLRRDGGWRRDDLFQPEGLRIQRLASRYGILAAGLWLASLAAWIVSSM